MTCKCKSGGSRAGHSSGPGTFRSARRPLSSYRKMTAHRDDRGHAVKVTVEITKRGGPDPHVVDNWESTIGGLTDG